jgi:hypothetical protein
MTPEMMAKVVMENYDPEFTKVHKMVSLISYIYSCDPYRMIYW